MNNAYILDWTMNKYGTLKKELSSRSFEFTNEPEKENIRVVVPYSRHKEFGEIIRDYLNAPQNYVDIQYPEQKETVLIFSEKTFVIKNTRENEIAKSWAISIGLPKEQAEWGISFL